MSKLISFIKITSVWMFVMAGSFAFAQTGSLRGKITTSDGKPAENVSVSLKGTGIGVLSDQSGAYSISAIRPGQYTVRVSAVGLQSQEKPVVITESSASELNFTLSESFQSLQEVVVSGGKVNKFNNAESETVAKMPLKKLENAQVYSVVTRALMEDQLVTNQDQALKNVPGIYQLWSATGRSGDGGSIYSLRGFVTQSLLRDGIAGQVISNADAANLENIEVIKGPSAALFGSILTSYGGLINRITKKPYDSVGGNITYLTGSFGKNRLAADLNTPVNRERTALFRINAAYDRTSSFQDFGFSKSFFVAPSFSYQLNDDVKIILDAEFSNVNSSGSQFMYLGSTPQLIGIGNADDLKFDFRRSFIGDELVTKTRTANVFGKVEARLSGVWTSSTNFTFSNNNAAGPQAWLYLLPDEQVSRNAWNLSGDDNAYEIQQNFNADFNIGSVRNRFLAGGDIYYSDKRSTRGYLNSTAVSLFTYDVLSYTGPTPTYSAFNRINIENAFLDAPQLKGRTQLATYSLYAADVVNLTEALIASASLRIDHFNNQGNYNPDLNTTEGNYAKTVISPRFGLVYQVIKDQVTLFGNYQNSFKNATNFNVDNKPFKPEQANQIEAGAKFDIFGNRLSSTLNYYNIRVKDVVRSDPGNPMLSIQDGTQKSEGFEAELTANPVTGLNLIAGYAFNDSKYIKADAAVNGLRPITAGPKNLVNFWASYIFPVSGALRGIGLGVGGNYGSETFAYNQYVTVNNVAERQTFILPSYTVLNASVFYNKPSYRISFRADNIGNEKYWNGYSTINIQAPRSFTGSIAYRF